MKRIIAVLLTLLMLLPVCAAAEESQFEPPTRSTAEVIVFNSAAETITRIFSDSLDGSIEKHFVVSATYDSSLDAIVCIVEMPYWSISELLEQTESLYIILEAMGASNASVARELQKIYDPVDAYTIGYGDDGEVKYLNVNGRDLTDWLNLVQD